MQKKKLDSHKNVYENKHFCGALMSSEDTKTLEINQYRKNDKTTFFIYADLEHSVKKNDGCNNHLQQKKLNIFHQVFQCLQYQRLKNEKISMMYTEVKTWKNFCESLLREYALEIIKSKRKKK